VSDVSDPERFVVSPTIWWPPDRRDEYATAIQAILDRFGDMRRYGCAQAALSLVADGGLEGAITNVSANPWDTVAGVHLVRAAGGVVTDVEGDPWRHDSTGLVASNGEAHDEVLAAARDIVVEE
jgi:myo-inositol-1(or 4)-monophosphatase